MEIESSAMSGPMDDMVSVPADLRSIAMEIGSEYADVVMQNGLAGHGSLEKASPEQDVVEGGKAAPLQSEAAQEKQMAEGVEQPAAACEPELSEKRGVEDEAGTELCDSPAGELTEEELLVRAVIMFLGGKGHPGRSGCGSAASKATNKLVHLARAVLFEIALR